METPTIESVTFLSLAQMTDIALGIIQPGVIHFDILHEILKVIIHHLNLSETRVQMKGARSFELQQFFGEKTSQITISKVPQFPPMKGSKVSKQTDHITRESTITPSVQAQEPLIRPSQSKKGPDNVVVLDSSQKPIEHTVSISVTQMQYVFDEIKNLQEQINELKYMPDNKTLINAIRETPKRDSTSKGGTDQTSSIYSTHDSGKPALGPEGQIRGSSIGEAPLVDMFQILTLTKRVDAVEEGVEKLASLIEDVVRDVAPASKEETTSVHTLGDLEGKSITVIGNRAALELLTKEIQSMKKMVYGEENEEQEVTGSNLQAKMKVLEVRLKNFMDQLFYLDRSTSEQTNTVFKKCALLEDLTASLQSDFQELKTSHNLPIKILNERCGKIEDILDNVASAQEKVLHNESERDLQISSVLEQLEAMKIIKVSKEEFDEALKYKLNVGELSGKVSEERFNTTFEDLRSHIEETIKRLELQEDLWQKALFEVQGEIMTKLEKNEMIALQDFVKQKLKTLQEKLKAMKIYQKEQEAAATKQKLLKKMQCLSCDAEVGMKATISPRDYPRSPTLPPSKTIAPYLAYELDALRKHHRGLAASRNLHHFEDVVKKKGRVENRYCGGLHTRTTPLQRVTRMGNFLEQWGPELTRASDNLIKGYDGNVYIGCDYATGGGNKPRQSLAVIPDILHERGGERKHPPDHPEKDEGIHRGTIRFREQEQMKETSSQQSQPKGSARSSVKSEDNKKIDTSKSIEVRGSEVPRKISAYSFDDDPGRFPYL